ncbi:hypothetical protein K7432_001960 [Basidiobolus ranarum]|uniref:SHSP domain-containing protein n=1 Tax=Basidiobolus ranarum TaxID=34480 RepID=A0ABR2W8R5_9FUNG
MKFISSGSILTCLLAAQLSEGFLLPTMGNFPTFNELESHFNQIRSDMTSFTPTVRSRTYPEEYVIQMEVPGFSSNELNLSFKNFNLLVEGEHKCDDEKDRDCLSKSISQAFYLPRDVNPDKIESTLENGILTIRSGRNETPEKKISVHSNN